MEQMTLREAKQKFSELVERVERGEQIGIICRGKLCAIIGPAPAEILVKQAFDGLEAIWRRVHARQNVNIKRLVEEGRA